MNTTRRALIVSLVERYLLITLGLASSVIVARLLTPEQIGIFAVSLAVVSVAQVLRDFGVVNYLIQVKELTSQHVRVAFGLSLLLGTTLCLLVAVAAPWVGDFYGEPRLVPVLRIGALSFLVLPFGTISLALLRREMQFQKALYATIAGGVAGFIATVGTAYAGFGPQSLAIGGLVTNAAVGWVAWRMRPDRFILAPSLRGARELVKFGAQSSAASVVTSISMDINDLAIGKIMGFGPVAIISRAQGLMNIFHRDVMSAIRNVALPTFAKAHREGKPIEAKYVEAVVAVTAVAWPFYGFVALFPLALLRLMFGPQWDAAVPLVVVFCLAGAIAACSNLALVAVIAVGRIDIASTVDLVFQPFRAVVMVCTAMVFKSLLACAIAYAACFVLFTPFCYLAKGRCIPNDWHSLWPGVLRNMWLTVAALAPACAVRTALGEGALAMALSAALTSLTWVAAIALTKHPLWSFLRAMNGRVSSASV